MNEKFEKFYENLGASRNKTALQTLMDDGAIITDIDQFNENGKNSVAIMNCYLNPFYFLDKLKINNSDLDINIGVYLAIRYFHLNNKNIVLDLPPCTGKTTFLLAYSLYLDLFCKKEVFYFGSSIAKNIIDELASSLPDFVKNSIDVDSMLTNIHINEKIIDGDEDDIVVIYDCIDVNGTDIKYKYPCIIANRLGDSDKYKDKLIDISDNSNRKFIQCRYSIKDLGYSMDDIMDIYASKYNETTLQDFLLNYAFV